MKPLPITIGHDPEFHVFDLKQRRIVSSIPVVGRDKHDPIELGNRFRMYSDNVLVECSFPESRSDFEAITKMRDVFRAMQTKLGDRYRLLPKAAHIYSEKELGPKPAVMKGELPVAWEVGCNPSFNAWDETINVPTPFTDGLRTGSFHIHIGNADLKDERLRTAGSRHEAVKLLDIFLGMASVLFDKDRTAKDRRKLYGKAGEFRPTSYGIEYRVLGPFAMQSPTNYQLVLDLIHYTINQIEHDRGKEILSRVDGAKVRRAIDTSNRSVAQELLGKVGLPKEFLSRCLKTKPTEFYSAWGI